MNFIFLLVSLNKDNKHFVSPVIFHDQPNDKTLNEKETVFSYFLRHPLLIFGFIIVGYYIYPLMWKKDYFVNLAFETNNKRVLLESENIYDYINYRRGLYVNVRSNFS